MEYRAIYVVMVLVLAQTNVVAVENVFIQQTCCTQLSCCAVQLQQQSHTLMQRWSTGG